VPKNHRSRGGGAGGSDEKGGRTNAGGLGEWIVLESDFKSYEIRRQVKKAVEDMGLGLRNSPEKKRISRSPKCRGWEAIFNGKNVGNSQAQPRGKKARWAWGERSPAKGGKMGGNMGASSIANAICWRKVVNPKNPARGGGQKLDVVREGNGGKERSEEKKGTSWGGSQKL